MKTESNSPTRGNQTDLAKRMGVTQQAVSQMVKKGVVQVEPDGKILLEQAVEDWQAHVNVGQQRPFRWKGTKTESYQQQMERYHRGQAAPPRSLFLGTRGSGEVDALMKYSSILGRFSRLIQANISLCIWSQVNISSVWKQVAGYVRTFPHHKTPY